MELRREIGLRDLVLFNVAAVVGIRWLAAAAHTGPGSITLWLAAAALFFVPSALAVATLSSKRPDEGGIYVWAREAFGPWHGFLCGWMYWLANLFFLPNLILAGLAMAGSALGLGQDRATILTLSLVVLWVVLIANVLGMRVAKWVGNTGGAATYLAGALIVAFGAAAWIARGPATPIDIVPEVSFDKLNFWSQIAFAFGGLELGAVMGGEVRDPKRTVPRAAWIAGVAISVFYVAGTLGLLALRTPDAISPLTGLIDAGADAGRALGVAWAGPLLAALVLTGVAGQLGAWVGAVARVPFVIGVDRYLPAEFGRLHPKYGTPHVAILTQGIACTAFVLALQAGETLRNVYQILVDLSVLTYFVPFLYLFAASWREGRRMSGACGFTVTALAMAVTCVPPPDVSSVLIFETKLIGGCAVLAAAAWVCFKRSAANREREVR